MAQCGSNEADLFGYTKHPLSICSKTKDIWLKHFCFNFNRAKKPVINTGKTKMNILSLGNINFFVSSLYKKIIVTSFSNNIFLPTSNDLDRSNEMFYAKAENYLLFYPTVTTNNHPENNRQDISFY